MVLTLLGKKNVCATATPAKVMDTQKEKITFQLKRKENNC